MELLRQRRTWMVLNAVLGAIVGLPLAAGSDLVLILVIAVVLVFGVAEQRLLASGEGWHWSVAVPFFAAWLASFLLFNRGL